MSQKNYEELCNRVEEIDAEAAKYMRTEAINLPCFDYSDELCCSFLFENTPQGREYWISISVKLG